MNWKKTFSLLLLSSSLTTKLWANDLAFSELLFDITFETAVSNLEQAQESLSPLKGLNAKLYAQNPSFYVQNLNSSKKQSINQCFKKYNSLYKDDVLEIQLFEGYRDHLPEDDVVSGPEHAAFIKTLTTPCSAYQSFVKTCGFTRDNNNSDLLRKKIVGLDKKAKVIELYVTSPAYSYSDEINRDSSKQKQLTEISKRKFQQALIHSDIVFYAGHSRKKGGPDFGPAKRIIMNGEFHVDYNWYAKNRPGMKLMTEALKKRETTNELIYGMFSCDSQESFSKDIKTSARVSTILSDRVTENRESQKAILTSLNAILSFSCDPQLGLKEQPFTASGIF